ncbi:MAG: hypothetical protein ACKOWC_03960 [Limnohabitans sp.]
MEKPPFEKPKVRLFGDTEQAQGYLGAAYNLLFKVRALAQAAGVPAFGKVLQLPDGAVVQAATIRGIDTVSVYPPGESVEPETELLEPPLPPPPVPLFLGLPASHAAQFGWFPPSSPGSLYGGARPSEGSPAEAAIWSNFRGKLFTTYLAGNMHWRAKDEKKAETVSWNWLGNTSKYDTQTIWLRVAGDPATSAYTTAVPIAGERSANYAAEEVANSQHAADLFILGKRVRAPFSILGACERKGKLIVAVPGTLQKSFSGSTFQNVYRLDFLVADSPRAAIAGGVHNSATRVPVEWTLLHSQARLESLVFFGGVFFSGDGSKAVCRSGNTTKHYEFAITEDEQGDLEVMAQLVTPDWLGATAFSSNTTTINTTKPAEPLNAGSGTLTTGTTQVQNTTTTALLFGRAVWDIKLWDGTTETPVTSGTQDFLSPGEALAFVTALPPLYASGTPPFYTGSKTATDYNYTESIKIYNMKGEQTRRAQGRSIAAVDVDANGRVVFVYREGDSAKTLTSLDEERYELRTFTISGSPVISPPPANTNAPAWVDPAYDHVRQEQLKRIYTKTLSGSMEFSTRTRDYVVAKSEVVVSGSVQSQRTYEQFTVGPALSPVYVTETTTTQAPPAGTAIAAAREVPFFDVARGVFLIAQGKRSITSWGFTSPTPVSYFPADADWSVTATNEVTMQVSVAGVLMGPTITEDSTNTHTFQNANPLALHAIIAPLNSDFAPSTNANRAYGLAALTPKRYIVSAPCYSLQTTKPHPTNYLAYASVDGKTKQITDIVKPPDMANFRFNPVKVR